MSDALQRDAVASRSTLTTIALGESEVLLAQQLEALDADLASVVVDLAGAKTVGSSLLSSLRDSAASIRARGGELVVVCRSPSLAGFLELMLFGCASVMVAICEEGPPACDRWAS